MAVANHKKSNLAGGLCAKNNDGEVRDWNIAGSR